MNLPVQFRVQTLVNLNRQSSSRFSQISELNAKFDSQFCLNWTEPDFGITSCIQPFASKSVLLMVFLWSVHSQSATWSVIFLFHTFRSQFPPLTLLNDTSNSAIDCSTVNIFQWPPFMGMTMKDTWTCTMSLMWNVCGSHGMNLSPPKCMWTIYWDHETGVLTVCFYLYLSAC